MTLQHPDALARPLLYLCALSLMLSACHQPRTHAPATPASTRSEVKEDTPDEAAGSHTAIPSEVPRHHDFSDANGNGVDDAIDITFMNSADENHNGIPDEAELDW